MSIVVTGATGHLGRLVVDELLTRTDVREVVALVRSPDRATALAEIGVQLRTGDYSRPDSLDGVFGRGDTVLLISGSELGQRETQHLAVLAAAQEAGVSRLVYTSILGGPKADFILAREHQATEDAIQRSGLPYTFLRNGWYNENYTGQIPTQLLQGLLSSTGQGRVASATRADFAAAAAVVLTTDGHDNAAYELSGDTAWNLDEYAEELSRQSGQQVSHTSVPAADYQASLVAAGVPEFVAVMLADTDQAVARGLLALNTGDLSRLIGRPTTPIAESIRDALKEIES